MRDGCDHRAGKPRRSGVRAGQERSRHGNVPAVAGRRRGRPDPPAGPTPRPRRTAASRGGAPAPARPPEDPARSARPRPQPASAPHRGGPLRTSERNPMNKAELVSAIAKRADVSASTVDSVIDGLREELVEAITRGDKVAVPGLITVERSQRSARTGRNPQTGECVES